MHLAIPRAKYPKDRDVAAFCDRMLERVRAVPGVVSAGLVNRLPLAGGAQTGPIEFEGIDPRVTARERRLPHGHARLLLDACVSRCSAAAPSPSAIREDAPPVAIIDERLAKTAFAGVDPVGRRVRIPSATCRG